MEKIKHIYSDSIDGAALAQFHDAMSCDFAVKGALMPDAHKGYSLPIGAVVATKGVVVPAWIGFDIGCTDEETEYLTKTGWKKISTYDSEEIMIYDLSSDSCKFETPKGYIVNDCEEFTLLDNSVVNQALTSDHKLLLFGERSDYPRDVLLQDAVDTSHPNVKGVTGRFKASIPYAGDTEVTFTEDELRLIIAIQADGCIRKTGRIEFHLKKNRKIQRLVALLERLDVEVSTYDLQSSAYGCSFRVPYATKDLSFLYEASSLQLQVVADEVKYWDAHIKSDGRVMYSTTSKVNADVIQYVFASIGIRANCQTQEYSNGWATGYTVYTTNNSYVGFPDKQYIHKIKSVDGKSYCFNTNSGYWVMRRKGRIAITGNCGVGAVKLAGVSKDSVQSGKDQIFNKIYEKVPVGFKANVTPTSHSLEGLSSDGRKIAVQKKHELALGSLGGGNHFIEIGHDESDSVWIVIHSGSRGVGHGIASHYMTLASVDVTYLSKIFDESHTEVLKHNPAKYESIKASYINKHRKKAKAKEGHYALPISSEDGNNYLTDMNWCLEYALANRKEMVRRVVSSIEEVTGNKVAASSWDDLINRNHNHATERDGLWIHRKGATHAEEGMMGVIPGNMRDGSFIVRGKGNPDSLWSSSHGAGRVLGRRQAKEILNLEGFQKSMPEGIKAKVEEDTLDESPDVYKNIFEVMANQKDLVEVVAHVTPIINIKG